MQRWNSVWVFTVLILALLSSATEARKTWELRAKHMTKKGFTLGCRSAGETSGPIVSLSVAGVAKKCRGLTASMLVQVNLCLWKKTCLLKADPHDQYMLRLFQGTPENCILQPPKKYQLSYHCARPKVPVIDLLPGEAEGVKPWRGIIRSHEDHPWLYRNRQDRTMTLVRPNATAATFLYTILKLRLYNDVLRVTTGDKKMAVISHQDDVTNMTANPIKGADLVRFELEMSKYSTGEEGFVICFQWLTDMTEEEMQKYNACNELLSPGDKPARMKGGRKRKPGKGGKRKNKQKKNKKGRRGKTTTTTTTPRP